MITIISVDVPEDFYDLTPEDYRELMAAAAEKRKKEEEDRAMLKTKVVRSLLRGQLYSHGVTHIIRS
jgi:hypothetical protein